jgi:hypothetical protein
MTTKEKLLDQYIRDKHTQEECIAYIQGWEDAYTEGYKASEEKSVKALYWVFTMGIVTGIILTLVFTLI